MEQELASGPAGSADRADKYCGGIRSGRRRRMDRGGPISFSGFKTPLASFAISAAIGITAGLSCADDAGRKYLIGVAAAVQFAIFPVWFGAAVVLGLPANDVLAQRILSFFINLVTISVCAAIAYAVLHLKSGGWAPAPGERLES
jgi:hypothetical protein